MASPTVATELDVPARAGRRLLEDLAALPGLPAADLPTLSAAAADGLTGHEPSRFPGLPTGVLDVAGGFIAAARAMLPGELAGRLAADCGAGAVLLGLALADRDGRPRPVRSRVRRAGEVALCADLPGQEEERQLAQLLQTMEPGDRADPERLSELAQGWRLPVLAYQSWRAAELSRAREAPGGLARVTSVLAPERSALESHSGSGPFAGLRICDLSTMWAGPLASSLMRCLGASVLKVEMPGRPDGLRRRSPGERGTGASAMYVALNGGKDTEQLDLRRARDRVRFERILRGCDLLVESFSRRVMGNLGYDEHALRRIAPGLMIAAIRAFPPGERAGWVSYGAGIHAASGLAELAPGRFGAACVSYPDPLAGLALFVAMIAQVLARLRAGAPSTVEVSLWDAVRPLLDLPQPGDLGADPTPAQVRAVCPAPAREQDTRPRSV